MKDEAVERNQYQSQEALLAENLQGTGSKLFAKGRGKKPSGEEKSQVMSFGMKEKNTNFDMGYRRSPRRNKTTGGRKRARLRIPTGEKEDLDNSFDEGHAVRSSFLPEITTLSGMPIPQKGEG